MAYIVPVNLKTFLTKVSSDIFMPVLRESKAYIKSDATSHVIKTKLFKGKTTLQIIECLYKLYRLCCNDNPKKLLNFSSPVELSVGVISGLYSRDYIFTRDLIIKIIEKIGFFTIKHTDSRSLIITYNNNDIHIRPVKNRSDLICSTFIGIIDTNEVWSNDKAELVTAAIQRTNARMGNSKYKFVLLVIPPEEINNYSYIKNILSLLDSIFFTVKIDPNELSDEDIDSYFE